MHSLNYLMALLVMTVGLFLLRRRLSPSIQACCYSFVVLSFATIIFSQSAGFFVSGGGIRGIYLYPESFEMLTRVFVFSLLALIAGAIFSSFIIQNAYTEVNSGSRSQKINNRKDLYPNVGVILKKRFSQTVFFLFPLLVYLSLFEYSNLLERQSYLFRVDNYVANLVFILLPTISVLCYLLLIQKDSTYKGFILFTLIFSQLLLFSRASRFTAVLFLVIAGQLLLRKKNRVTSVVLGSISFAFFLYTFDLVLKLRNLESHGFRPYTAHMYENGFFFDTGNSNVLGNLLSIFAVIWLGVQRIPPENFFWMTFNPLPGRLIGWYNTENFTMINPATPAGGLAQFASAGLGSLLAGLFLFGFLNEYSHRLYAKFQAQGIVRYIPSVITLVSFVLLLQYPARNSFRFVYLNLFLAIIFYANQKSRSRIYLD
jgi:hypothetical protein